MALDHFRLATGSGLGWGNVREFAERQLQTTTHLAAVYERNFGEAPLMAIGTKHCNPCGAAVETTPAKVLQDMLPGDLEDIFGGLVMVNFPVYAFVELAEVLIHWKLAAGVKRRLLDLVVAPHIEADVVALLRRKDDRCQVLENLALAELGYELARDQRSSACSATIRQQGGG